MDHSPPTILATQPNFRDLGGIVALDGRRIRKGLLYRSGDLFSVDAGDIRKLEQLNLSVIIDFRAHREVEKRPNPLIATLKQAFHLPIHDAGREKTELLFEQRDAAGLERVLVDDYRRMIREHQSQYRDFFSALTMNGHDPLMYHCAAGKDRTGLATWFLLSALGVDEAVIRRNYMESNDYTYLMAEKVMRKINAKGLPGEMIRPLMEVRSEYIDAALDEIRLLAGTMDAFLTENLGVDASGLKAQYLI
jgi:protein-tyrosine phosphatase